MKDMKETGVQSREKGHKHYERHEGDRSTEHKHYERRGTKKGHYERHEGDRSTEQREGAQTL